LIAFVDEQFDRLVVGMERSDDIVPMPLPVFPY
jgi:hypothetical protein